MKSVIIAADDYAQSADIDAGILQLIHMGRVTAASCLTLSPRWPMAAKELTQSIRAKADIGLHLDFTQYNPMLKGSLPAIILKSYARVLPIKKVRAAIHAQLDAFEQALGTPPDYIDGHQHVHQLPQIREALIDALTQRYQHQLPWLRIAKPPASDGLKALIIGRLGANSLMQQAKKAGIRHTALLLGVYQFESNFLQYQQQLKGWLSSKNTSKQPAALMCHPAILLGTLDKNDPIFSARLIEYQALSDDYFMTLLHQYNIQLVRGNILN